MAADKPQIHIYAERLLTLIQATRPLAGKDDERPHLMMVRFAATASELEAAATDGHTAGKVSCELNVCSEPVIFCIATEYLPMVEKLLARLDLKERAEAQVEVVVGRLKVYFKVQQSEIYVPKTPEQLQFPDVEKVFRSASEAKDRVGEWGMSPSLVSRVLRCAGRACHAVLITAPETTEKPIRIDLSSGGAYTGTFLVMPMRLDELKKDSEPAEPSAEAEPNAEEEAAE